MESLPELALLRIFRYIIDIKDKMSVLLVCKKWNELGSQPAANVHVRCTGQSFATHKVLQTFIRRMGENLSTLDLNMCRWLHPFDLICSLPKLRSLHVIETLIENYNLLKAISFLPQLTRLSFTVQDIKTFERRLDNDSEVSKCFENLISLKLYIPDIIIVNKSMQVVSYANSFLSYCKNLEEIHLEGVAYRASRELTLAITVCEYFTSWPVNPYKIKVLTLSGEGQLCKYLANCVLKSVLVARGKLTTLKLQNNSLVIDCLRWHQEIQMEEMRHLDLLGYNMVIPNPVVNFRPASYLQYLNFSNNVLLDSNALKHIAQGCPRLNHLNAEGCICLLETSVQEREPQPTDLTGIESLVMTCKLLRTVNMSRIKLNATPEGVCDFDRLAPFLCFNDTWQVDIPASCDRCAVSYIGNHPIRKLNLYKK